MQLFVRTAEFGPCPGWAAQVTVMASPQAEVAAMLSKGPVIVKPVADSQAEVAPRVGPAVQERAAAVTSRAGRAAQLEGPPAQELPTVLTCVVEDPLAEASASLGTAVAAMASAVSHLAEAAASQGAASHT